MSIQETHSKRAWIIIMMMSDFVASKLIDIACIISEEIV